MKLQHDDYYNEEHGSGSRMAYVYMALIMSVVILAVTALMFWTYNAKNRNDGRGYAAAVAQKNAQSAQSENAQSGTAANDKLTSDQLDIWMLPDTGREASDSLGSGANNGTVTNKTTGEIVSEGSSGAGDNSVTADELSNGKTSVYDKTESESEKNTETQSSEESSGQETRISVEHADGTQEWVDLSGDIPRNKYDYSNLKSQNSIMSYSENGKIISKCGADISAGQGEVDFAKLKKAGCDFVMIKVGARGYSSGNIVFDQKYKENINAAKKAGLDVGVYFCSQAVTKAEARDEADELLDAIASYDVNYPIAFVMENVDGDMARIESLDKDGRTTAAKSFLDRIKDAGYAAMLYGDKEWLLTMLDMDRLSDYDVWYAQNGKEPEYPYAFGMWQYDSAASINGISGEAALSMSFKDYSKK